jgi:hypothetical protein
LAGVRFETDAPYASVAMQIGELTVGLLNSQLSYSQCTIPS